METSTRRRWLGGALALLTVSSVALAQDRSVIEQVDTARMAVLVRTGSSTRAVHLSPSTLVVIAGMPGQIEDLRPGQTVRIQLAVTAAGASTQEAVRIEVLTR